MKITEKLLEAIKTSETYIRTNESCLKQSVTWSLLSIELATVEKEKNGYLVFLSVDCVYNLNNEQFKSISEFQFRVGLSTPSGYFSAKKIPVEVANFENLTESELNLFMEYWNIETKVNTFDPRWHEKNAESKNASAWASIAANHLQPDAR